MKLNTKKINELLEKEGRKKTWLADQIGVKMPLMSYILKEGSIKYAAKIGKALNISWRNLIIED